MDPTPNCFSRWLIIAVLSMTSGGAAPARIDDSFQGRAVRWPVSSVQRTWLAEAARRREGTLTSQGSDLGYFLGLVMTGHAGWEHPVQFVPIYNDVATFFGQARAHYSAQLIMSDYPIGTAIEYWYGANDLWEDSKLMHWSPWQETASRRSFVKKPAREFMFPILAEGAADMKRAGAYIAVGAHGEQDGLRTHGKPGPMHTASRRWKPSKRPVWTGPTSWDWRRRSVLLRWEKWRTWWCSTRTRWTISVTAPTLLT